MRQPGQPGHSGQQVARTKSRRILPTAPGPTIYAAGSERPTWAVRVLPPQSADKVTWQVCEGLVLAALTDPKGLHEETLASAKRMTDLQWQCAYERSMRSCYLFQKAPTKTADGLMRSRKANEDFLNDMQRRERDACRTVSVEGDAQEVIDAINARAVWHNWKPATAENFNRALLDEASPGPPTAALQEAALQAKLRARPKAITTGRATQRPPDVDGIPRKALDACWDKTQQCINNMGGSTAWADSLFQCVRWRGAQQCAGKGSRHSHPDKSDEEIERRWGGVWSYDTMLGKFDERWRPHCTTAFREGADPEKHVQALQLKCDSLWTALFR
ncbi:hypothetical protein [Myxococcus sp. CA039A]|uniref:hypothetical protein n=1 Tax=Myxococcus sp. CA039A TaxID=2741737 RepID=UPI00157A3820|nr:hypothetical protein [Myxococcus sp. CA039A]NTX58385.1 hypothetical protein [Myxococcus sp. CA039A]